MMIVVHMNLLFVFLRFTFLNRYLVEFFNNDDPDNEFFSRLELSGWMGFIFLTLCYQMFYLLSGIQVTFVIFIAECLLALLAIFDSIAIGIITDRRI